MSEAVRLQRGEAEASLVPQLGGAVGRFTVAGRDILRPTPEHATDPLETACFPLVPYANRIAGGRFTFAGASYALPPNHAGFPQALHGLGWLMPWIVAERSDSIAVLACSRRADAHWAWDWSATQRFELLEHALRISLELTNSSERAMPAGLGLHPYLVRRSDDVLQFRAKGLWHNDDAMIPDRLCEVDALGDFARGAAPRANALIDNCYAGWTGTARWSGAVRLKARGSRFLHVYAPPHEHFVCLEPTSQMPDALNRPEFLQAGGTVLAPGATQVLELEISGGR